MWILFENAPTVPELAAELHGLKLCRLQGKKIMTLSVAVSIGGLARTLVTGDSADSRQYLRWCR